MAKVLDWRRSEDLRDVVHLSVQALVEGQLVAFPTETSYELVANAIKPEAIERIMQILPADYGKATLMMRSPEEATDFAPDFSPVAKRMAARGWPGPLTLDVSDSHPDSLVRQLPETAQSLLLAPNGRIALRIPMHDAINQVAKMADGPLIMVPAKNGQGKLVVSTDQLDTRNLCLVVDDGLTQYQDEPTVIHVDGNRCSITQAGVIDAKALGGLSQMIVLLVCTGNTCRSPMAEAMMQAKMEKKFATQFANSTTKPIVACSAGISAMAGGRASTEAVRAMQDKGLDLQHHESCPLNQRLVERADLILTMTSSHRQAILSRWPSFANKTFPIAMDGEEISDPFGGPIDLYRACADQLNDCLDRWLETIDESMLAVWENS
jgi:protein-tyrosine-phosphatase/tRNA A37 threonylcarbamoyladenosine synthetase subunit TsaC/SUA5/YrdC